MFVLEEDFDFSLICYLKDWNIIFLMGYINVGVDFLEKVVDVGVLYMMYFFNVMSCFYYCELGGIGMVFVCGCIMVELIIDGIYFYFLVVKFVFLVKGS